MKRLLLATAVAMTFCEYGTIALADTPAPFEDAACPQANDSGRKLNELNAAGNVSGDDLMAAAQGLVDAYKDCALAFDRSQNSKNADHQSDYIPVNRMYSRLQLARSYQRVGSFYEQLHQPDKARIEYNEALQPLDQLNQIMSGSTVGLADKGSPEFRLQSEGLALHDQIVASLKKLPPAAAPSPQAT